METYVYEIPDDHGQSHQGFEAVAILLQTYYQYLLGPGLIVRAFIDPQVIALGSTLSVEQQFRLCAPFSD